MQVSPHILDFLVVGLLLLGVTLGSSWIARLPLSYALIYLIAGILLGPYGINIIDIRPDTEFLERLTEIVVIVSLFACGIKMNRPLNSGAWNSTIRLIGLLMPISILAIAAVGHYLLGFNWGAAILLGAILAPTDPVLASEVQLAHTNDRNELRFGLTSEGGLNDALAFPFVYFGLYWLKDPRWENWFASWAGIDLIWAIAAGVAGGILVTKVINWLGHHSRKTFGVEEEMEDLVALATILLAYALTELINGYGFLAVFIAGMTVRRSQSLNSDKKVSQLYFTGQIERLLEVGTILLVGAILRFDQFLLHAPQTLLVAGLLLFIIRPVGTWISTIGSNLHPVTRLFFGWFGIRGVGSLYYMTYALSEGIPEEIGAPLSWITVLTIGISVVLHGVSATPLMKWYEKYTGEKQIEPEDENPEESEAEDIRQHPTGESSQEG